MTANQRLQALRQVMKEHSVDAYLVQSSDYHQSEYLAPHFAERAWLTGFTGSAGLAIITQDQALVWADGRYTIQVKRQLEGSDFKPMAWTSEPGAISPQAWLRDNLPDGSCFAYCGAYMSPAQYQTWLEALEGKQVKLLESEDLVGKIWTDRPALKQSQAFLLPVKYAGLSGQEKLTQVRQKLSEKLASHTVLASLDDVAWLFNLRGNDIQSNPVNFAYALVSPDQAILYINPEKVKAEIAAELAGQGVELRPYDQVYQDLGQLPDQAVVFYDPQRFNRRLYKALPEGVEKLAGTNITTELKAVKNATEEAMQRQAYHLDALALTRFMYWLHQEVEIGRRPITEWQAQEHLLSLRQAAASFIEPSFTTIAAYGPNAAMMHYSASPETTSVIEPRGFFLFDSGGQYYEGTTDITRTQMMGELTQEMRLAYTYTLKSALSVMMGRFLAGYTGAALDAIARSQLWQIGSDYKCGTGHGVGFCLNVHEGPHGLSSRSHGVQLKPGMVVTVEPGVYLENKFGIRIENVVIIKEDIKNESGQFLRCDMLDYIPIDTRPVLTEHLSRAELDWLNAYQKRSYDELKDLLDPAERAWLKDFSAPLEA